MENKSIKILLAAPRGFCAGVDRAIEIVKKSIQKYGSPVYVRHEIVHNKHVVESLKKIGAIFVEELDEIKDKSRPVIFSAHGVPKSVPLEAFDETINQLANKVSNMPTKALGLIKELFNQSMTNSLEVQLALESKLQIEAASSNDYAEGVASFIEKRKPNFKGN